MRGLGRGRHETCANASASGFASGCDRREIGTKRLKNLVRACERATKTTICFNSLPLLPREMGAYELIDSHVSSQQCEKAVSALVGHATKIAKRKEEHELLPG